MDCEVSTAGADCQHDSRRIVANSETAKCPFEPRNILGQHSPSVIFHPVVTEQCMEPTYPRAKRKTCSSVPRPAQHPANLRRPRGPGRNIFMCSFRYETCKASIRSRQG